MAEALHFSAILTGGWAGLDWQPFREGIEIFPLLDGEPGIALLRYAPGAAVPRHLHTGLETIMVLEGVQSDEHGDYPAGSVILNPEGTVHSVWSDQGCMVLVQWNRAVQFLP